MVVARGVETTPPPTEEESALEPVAEVPRQRPHRLRDRAAQIVRREAAVAVMRAAAATIGSAASASSRSSSAVLAGRDGGRRAVE